MIYQDDILSSSKGTESNIVLLYFLGGTDPTRPMPSCQTISIYQNLMFDACQNTEKSRASDYGPRKSEPLP